MLLTLDAARHVLSKLGLTIAGTTALGLAMLLFPLFDSKVFTTLVLLIITIGAIGGFFIGTYAKFRSKFNSTYGLYGFLYAFLVLQVMFTGGSAALLVQILGRSDLRWLAFGSSFFCLVLTLFGGMHREAKALYLFDKTKPEYWKDALKQHFEFERQIVKPSLTSQMRDIKDGGTQTSYIWIAAGASVNIPLLFEIYGGGKNNAIYLVLIILLGTFTYINIKNLGPGLLRLIVLRRLEKSLGYRLINADLEQIQALRRSFFLSRWLMKDYVKP